jgi:hypothetical protein
MVELSRKDKAVSMGGALNDLKELSSRTIPESDDILKRFSE